MSVDYLINDNIEVAKSDTTTIIPSRHLSKLNIIYNSTDVTKICKKENFSVDNSSLYIVYINPDEYPIAAREELKLQIYIMLAYGDKTLGALQNRSVTVKYAGQAIATIKW